MGAKGRTRHLLAFRPLLDDTRMTSESHASFLRQVIADYRLDPDNLVALVGDNCSTNTELARLMNVPLIGCHSHRLNLALQEYLASYKTEIDCISKVLILVTCFI